MPVFKNTLDSKLPKVETTIFTVMSKLAQENGAINLSQGFPDFEPHPYLLERTNHYMKSGNNQYAPMQGVRALREKIAEKTNKLYGASYDVDTEITVTAGATQAIYTAITACVREGDEVLIFTPAYDCYEPAILLNGGKPVYIQLKAPHYGIDWDEVKKLINRKTRLIIINTPHNPSGAVLTETDMQELERLTSASEVLILSDEVYEHIVFDGKEHQSVTRYPSLAERSFVISSFGKTYHCTGWKLGYCLAPEMLMAEFRKIHQFIVFTVNTPAQMALADMLDRPEHYLELAAFYQEKRDHFIKNVQGSRFDLVPSAGTYFQLLSYDKITDELDVDFARRLTTEYKLASIPVSVFYHQSVDHKVLRFCFAKGTDTLDRAAEILHSI